MAPLRTAILDDVRLDILARQLFGTETNGAIEALLKANPGLAAGGPFIFAGAVITVPDFAATPPLQPSVNPWE